MSLHAMRRSSRLITRNWGSFRTGAVNSLFYPYFQLYGPARDLVQPGNFFSFLSFFLSLRPPFSLFFGAVSHRPLLLRPYRTKEADGKDRGQRILRCSHETRLHVRPPTSNSDANDLSAGHRFPFPLLPSPVPTDYPLVRARARSFVRPSAHPVYSRETSSRVVIFGAIGEA